eukprot:scaffold1210_cov410-Prasinococcus_capsulatus_cf.AAC.14
MDRPLSEQLPPKISLPVVQRERPAHCRHWRSEAAHSSPAEVGGVGLPDRALPGRGPCRPHLRRQEPANVGQDR